MFFFVGEEERPVPTHKIILQASGKFRLCSSDDESDEDVIQLQDVACPILHALLQYISESQLGSLWALSTQFEPHSWAVFPFGIPINVQSLQQLYLTSEYSDISVYVEGYGFIPQSHKIILSLYSVPFAKTFTNGMCESNSSDVCLRDESPKALKAVLEFMYSGGLRIEDTMDFGTLLLQLLLLSDKYGITLLHQGCCKMLLECLSEDSVCPIPQVVSSIPSCKLVEETCERQFAMRFNYYTTASLGFILLDEATFRSIIQVVDELMMNSTPEHLFKERVQLVNDLLPSVHFPLLPSPLLKKLENTNLSRQISAFGKLVSLPSSSKNMYLLGKRV
ncbi:hypothetical protein SLEP1_g11186 [Rubroshorea leprosula]|uniref:BTB domain-containing protein n=1 Tax=Rubroshorea leprosula TaxID=152421 RepID=A0AAV5IGA7_9ROSI|nr:hypothetical protein SLEP1_g11186 [Rubroshorea leprosula]